MKVLFIGYPKCGTKTMNIVFKTLGYSVYDTPENYYYLQKEWTKIYEEGATPEDFKRMYADVDACVSAPVYPFWEEILAAFPETKRAPKDQLHVVDFKQGWEPICKFLDVPAPDEPFPHANKAGELLSQFMKNHPLYVKIRREAIITTTVVATLLAFGIYYLLCLYW